MNANPLKENKSWAEVPAAVINDPRLRACDLLTLLVVRFHDRRDKDGNLIGGHCTSSIATLAAEARLSTSSVKKSLKHLNRLGYLAGIQPGAKAGRSANIIAIDDAYYWRDPDPSPPKREPRRRGTVREAAPEDIYEVPF